MVRKLIVALAFVLGLSTPSIGKDWPEVLLGHAAVCDTEEQAVLLYEAAKRGPEHIRGRVPQAVLGAQSAQRTALRVPTHLAVFRQGTTALGPREGRKRQVLRRVCHRGEGRGRNALLPARGIRPRRCRLLGRRWSVSPRHPQ